MSSTALPLGFSVEQSPDCRLDGCFRPVSGRSDLCKSHRDYVRRHGREPTKLWARDRFCVVCGVSDWPANGRRRCCSDRCQQLLQNSNGAVRQEAACYRCGSSIDLFATSTSGRKKRAEAKVCDRCKAERHVRHHGTVMKLVERDGETCGICGEVVDLDLRHPDRMSATVDHVIPYARGGPHDFANYQLAHLTCNAQKRDRAGWLPIV